MSDEFVWPSSSLATRASGQLLGAGACFAFPGVDWVASRSQALFPNDGDLWGANLLEHSLAAGDPVRARSHSCHPRLLRVMSCRASSR